MTNTNKINEEEVTFNLPFKLGIILAIISAGYLKFHHYEWFDIIINFGGICFRGFLCYIIVNLLRFDEREFKKYFWGYFIYIYPFFFIIKDFLNRYYQVYIRDMHFSILCGIIDLVFITVIVLRLNQFFIKLKELDRLDTTRPTETLGPMNNVISSLKFRAKNYSKITADTLILILVIVSIGGLTSIGSAVLHDFRDYRTFEKEINKISDLTSKLNALKSLPTKNHQDTLIVIKVDSILQIMRNSNLDEASIKQSINELKNLKNTSWEDMVMRITIAALTLFLCQIFYQIYKYNQNQTAYLFAKAEILELFRDIPEDQKEMRAMLLAQLEKVPKFEKTTEHSLEQLIKMLINKFKKR